MSTKKISKEVEKKIQARLKGYAKLKGAALRAAYAEVVGRDTNETSRERLLNGIARILYHNAEMAQAAVDTKRKDAQKGGKTGKPSDSDSARNELTDAVCDMQSSSNAGHSGATANAAADTNDGAPATATNDDAVAAGDRGGTLCDAPNGPHNANAEASAVAAGAGFDGEKKSRMMRAPGERDPRLPPAGTVLKKKHKDVTYEVTLLRDNGCLHDGKEYKSLSGFVKAVTGTNHNGLLWFGLTKRERKAKKAEMSAGSGAAQAE